METSVVCKQCIANENGRNEKPISANIDIDNEISSNVLSLIFATFDSSCPMVLLPRTRLNRKKVWKVRDVILYYDCYKFTFIFIVFLFVQL